MNLIKECFSDGGQISYSRCASGVIVLACVSWVSYIVFRTRLIPDLQGVALFLSTGVGVHYGSNKLPDILSAFGKRDADKKA